MTKSISWIWFAVLLMAVVLMLTGCGEPSRAGRTSPATPINESSPAEVVRTPEATPPTASAENTPAVQVAEPLAAVEANVEALSVTPVGRPQDRTTDYGGRIPTDRFRAIPIEQTVVDTPPRESYEEILLLVPGGTRLEIEFLDGLSSQESEIGDRFVGRVVEAVNVDGYFAIPVGAEIGGEVVDVKRLRKIGGQARLALSFDRLGTLSGATIPIRASLFDEGRDETRRDAAIIGGAAVAGAVVGRAVKDKKKAKGGFVGTLLGAAVGVGIAAATEGEPIEVPAGSRASLVLEQDLEVTVRVRVIES